MNKKIKSLFSFNKEFWYLITFFLIIASLFLFNKHEILISSESDSYFHALGAYFVYDLTKWWLTNPTFSYKAIESFVINYELQFKFFGGISHYQPFQSFFVAFLAFFSGKNHITFYIATVIETIITLFYSYRLYMLLYGKRKEFLYLTMFFIAFHPAIFNFAASFSLEPGVMMFSIMTFYYFIRFLRFERRRDLIFASISFGFGVLTKAPIIIVLPILLLSIIFEKRIRLFLKNYKTLLLSFLIFLIIISPWLIMEYTFYNLKISKIDHLIENAVFNFDIAFLRGFENINLTIFYIFGSYFLIPFFIYKFFRSKIQRGEITIIIFIILYPLFYNLIPNVQSRYLIAVVPFVAILSIKGLDIFHQKYNRNNILSYFIVLVMLFLTLTTFNFTLIEKRIHSSTDVLSPAIYINDRIFNRTTVLSTQSKMQSVAFNVLNDENVVIVRAPFKHEGGEQELKIMLDSKYYLIRPHRPEWRKFNLTHPPIEWVVIHERYDGLEPDYKLKDIIDKRDDFKLEREFEGNWKGNRVFIYRRKI